MINKYLYGSNIQKKGRSVPDRHLLQCPSSIPACIYPVQIRFRKNGGLPASADQFLYLSLIWHTCHLHFSLCNIPKSISLSLKTLAYIDTMTRIRIKKCDSGGEYFSNLPTQLIHIIISLVFYDEIAPKECNANFTRFRFFSGDQP